MHECPECQEDCDCVMLGGVCQHNCEESDREPEDPGEYDE